MQPGMPPNMQQMMQQMQEQLAAAQAREVTGTAGGGLVTARVTGGGELVGLEIDPKAVDPDDTETLADLVVAAVRDATGKAQDVMTEAMGPLAGGLGGLGLPGF